MFRQLDAKTLVAGQISPGDLHEAKRLGVTVVVNNRPDHEEPGQPLSAEFDQAASEAGIKYRYIPIGRGIGPAEVEATRDAIEAAGDGKLLAFCRSGMRSALAWAVASRERGVPREEIERFAEGAGYSLVPVSHLL